MEIVMRRHTQPHKAKKVWRKKSAKGTSFEIEVSRQRENVETNITYVMKISDSPCSVCHCKEHGRVFKVTGIKEIYSLCDWEPVPSDIKGIKKVAVGKNFCFNCLP